jgi:hypothetical protein
LSQTLRAPFGELNVEVSCRTPKLRMKKKDSKIDPSVVVNVKNVR